MYNVVYYSVMIGTFHAARLGAPDFCTPIHKPAIQLINDLTSGFMRAVRYVLCRALGGKTEIISTNVTWGNRGSLSDAASQTLVWFVKKAH